MLCLGLSHGDIQEFLDKKLDLAKLTNANVSVVFDENAEEFFRRVKNDEEFELKHNGRVVGTCSAKKLWSKIVDNALKGGEPGLLNGYLANKMNNIWYRSSLVSTNPCGEIWLAPYDCCCLGALVLPRFISGRGIEWDTLKQTVKTAVRFLDNVLTVNKYPLPKIEQMCQSIRRVGLGIMGLHDALLLSGMKYNSPEGLELVHKLMNRIKNYAYEASVELAQEKGAFPDFVAEKFLKSNYVKTLKPTIRKKIMESGIRNCALLTIAPTGTTSMVCGVTSGIEPMYAPAYERKYRDGETKKTEMVIHPLLKKYISEEKDVSHFQGCYDLSLRDHFEMQRICQQHIDNAVSKTINLQPGTSAELLSDLYMEYFPELKGVTVYPEGSREDQPLTPISLEDAIKYAKQSVEEAHSLDTCKDGSCDI